MLNATCVCVAHFGVILGVITNYLVTLRQMEDLESSRPFFNQKWAQFSKCCELTFLQVELPNLIFLLASHCNVDHPVLVWVVFMPVPSLYP